MHYPHKISRIKKVRAVGFRKRMSTRKGRKIINSKRRTGQRKMYGHRQPITRLKIIGIEA